MSATHRIENIVIRQGQTYRDTFERWEYPYPVHLAADGRSVLKEDGTPAPDTDRVLENYTGCTGEAKLYDQAGVLIATLNTDLNGGMVLGGATVELYISDEATAAMTWQRAEADVNITRANGDTERHYELTFTFSPQAPRGLA